MLAAIADHLSSLSPEILAYVEGMGSDEFRLRPGAKPSWKRVSASTRPRSSRATTDDRGCSMLAAIADHLSSLSPEILPHVEAMGSDEFRLRPGAKP